MKITKYIFVLSAFLFTAFLQAQNKHDLSEFNGGYREGSIKGLTIPDSALAFL